MRSFKRRNILYAIGEATPTISTLGTLTVPKKQRWVITSAQRVHSLKQKTNGKTLNGPKCAVF